MYRLILFVALQHPPTTQLRAFGFYAFGSKHTFKLVYPKSFIFNTAERRDRRPRLVRCNGNVSYSNFHPAFIFVLENSSLSGTRRLSASVCYLSSFRSRGATTTRFDRQTSPFYNQTAAGFFPAYELTLLTAVRHSRREMGDAGHFRKCLNFSNNNELDTKLRAN